MSGTSRLRGRLCLLGAIIALSAASLCPALAQSFDPSNWTLNAYHPFGGTGTAQFINSDNTLQLTSTTEDFEALSAYENSQAGVSAFTVNFTYQVQYNTAVSSTPADGATFTIQNDGLNAVGYTGSDFGYSNTQDSAQPNVKNSIAVAFNLLPSHSGGVGTTLLFDGKNIEPGGKEFTYQSAPILETTQSHVGTLTTFDPIDVTLTYTATSNVLDEILYDPITGNTDTFTYNIGQLFSEDGFTTSTDDTVAEILGSDQGYYGFTAGDGNVTSNQFISNFSVVTPEASSLANLAGVGLALCLAMVFARRRSRSAMQA